MLVVEGSIKYRHKKHWKKRWCEIEVASVEDDKQYTVIVTLYKANDRSHKHLTHHPKVVKVSNFCGCHSKFVLDQEANTIAILGSDNLIVLALEDEPTCSHWMDKIESSLGSSDQSFDMFMIKAPKSAKIASAQFVKLFLLGDYLSVLSLSPVCYVTAWQIDKIEDYGIEDGDRFFVKGPTVCNKGIEVFKFQSSSVDDLEKAMTNRLRKAEKSADVLVDTMLSDLHHRRESEQPRASQTLNFYQDFYIRAMRRSSAIGAKKTSTNSLATMCECRSSSNARSRARSLQFCTSNSSTSLSVAPKSSLHALNVHSEPSFVVDGKSHERPVIYDVPPTRNWISTNSNKCGIYDVPLSWTTNPPKKLLTTLSDESDYDKVPPPRRISTSSIQSQLYDTPPKPRPLSYVKQNSVCDDVSPKTRADYNMPLRYVDLSKYDGCCEKSSEEQHRTRKSGHLPESASWRPSPIGPKLPSRERGDNKQLASLYDTVTSNPVPVNNYKNAQISHKKSTVTFSKNTVSNNHSSKGIATATHAKTSHSDLHVNNSSSRLDDNTRSDIHDDGYVMVSESAVIDQSKLPSVRMRSDSHKGARRQQSLDSSIWRCSTDSGRMTSSNTSLSSCRRRESCSSYSGGSHLSLSSPSKVRLHSPSCTSQEDSCTVTSRRSSFCSSQDYMNVSQLCSTPPMPRQVKTHAMSLTKTTDLLNASNNSSPDTMSSDINYADLDFDVQSKQGWSPRKPALTSNQLKGSKAAKSGDIEYVMINIVATEAIRKASEEHNKYRHNKHTVLRAH